MEQKKFRATTNSAPTEGPASGVYLDAGAPSGAQQERSLASLASSDYLVAFLTGSTLADRARSRLRAQTPPARKRETKTS
jgi:hypothetical protein